MIGETKLMRMLDFSKRKSDNGMIGEFLRECFMLVRKFYCIGLVLDFLQGPTLPVLDLNFFPIVEEGLRVTDELCAQYRVLKREVDILQEENLRLRRMLELFLAPIMISPPPLKE
jgi:hypothetical protein